LKLELALKAQILRQHLAKNPGGGSKSGSKHIFWQHGALWACYVFGTKQ